MVPLIRGAEHANEAILLDVDNGPEAFTAAGNDRLYSPGGLQACMRALTAKGCLAIWSVSAAPAFERRLRQAQLYFRRVPVGAYKGARSRSRLVWVVSRKPRSLPAE